MLARDLLRSISQLAPGKRVTVRAAGIMYVLPAEPPPPEIEPPHPMEVVAKQLLASNDELRGAVTTVADCVSRIGEATAAVQDGQREVVSALNENTDRVNENTRTLMLPVRPAFDKAGKLVAAQRADE